MPVAAVDQQTKYRSSRRRQCGEASVMVTAFSLLGNPTRLNRAAAGHAQRLQARIRQQLQPLQLAFAHFDSIPAVDRHRARSNVQPVQFVNVEHRCFGGSARCGCFQRPDHDLRRRTKRFRHGGRFGLHPAPFPRSNAAAFDFVKSSCAVAAAGTAKSNPPRWRCGRSSISTSMPARRSKIDCQHMLFLLPMEHACLAVDLDAFRHQRRSARIEWKRHRGACGQRFDIERGPPIAAGQIAAGRIPADFGPISCAA